MIFVLPSYATFQSPSDLFRPLKSISLQLEDKGHFYAGHPWMNLFIFYFRVFVPFVFESSSLQLGALKAALCSRTGCKASKEMDVVFLFITQAFSFRPFYTRCLLFCMLLLTAHYSCEI